MNLNSSAVANGPTQHRQVLLCEKVLPAVAYRRCFWNGRKLLRSSPDHPLASMSGGLRMTSNDGASRVQKQHALVATCRGACAYLGDFGAVPPLNPLARQGCRRHAAVALSVLTSPRRRASYAASTTNALPLSSTHAHKRCTLFNAAADSIVLELASSPGRIVGDARGRWGVGKVPVEETGETPAQLSAALHVFALAEAESSEIRSEAAMLPAALLVESAVDSAGVVQLLHKSSGAPSSSGASLPGSPHAPSVANAVVLSSRLPGIA